MMLNILITNGWHDDNKGDSGIVLAIMELIYSITPARVTLVTEFGEDDIRLKDGYRHIISEYPDTSIVSPPWPIYPVKKNNYPVFLQDIFERIYRRLLKPLLPDRKRENIKCCLDDLITSVNQPVNEAGEINAGVSWNAKSFWDIVAVSDIVISKGGSFVFSDGTPGGAERLARVLYPLYVAIILKKPVVLFSQSIWGLENELEKSISLPVLKRSVVFTREKISQQYLERNMNISCEVVPDAGFYLSEKRELKHQVIDIIENEIAKGNKIVGVTVRDWIFSSGKGKYIKGILDILENICRRDENVKIALIPQVTGPVVFEDDRMMMWSIYKQANSYLKKQMLISNEDISPYVLKEVYRRLLLIIGTRLHSVIFSLSVGVPGIALSYSAHKSYGIMDMIGMKDCVFPIDQIPVKSCLEKIDEIISKRDELVDRLKKDVELFKKSTFTTLKQIIIANASSGKYAPLKKEELTWTKEIAF